MVIRIKRWLYKLGDVYTYIDFVREYKVIMEERRRYAEEAREVLAWLLRDK